MESRLTMLVSGATLLALECKQKRIGASTAPVGLSGALNVATIRYWS